MELSSSVPSISGAVHSRETIAATEEGVEVVTDGDSTYLRYFSTTYIMSTVRRQPTAVQPRKAEAYGLYVAFTFLCCSPIYALPALVMSIFSHRTSNRPKAKWFGKLALTLAILAMILSLVTLFAIHGSLKSLGYPVLFGLSAGTSLGDALYYRIPKDPNHNYPTPSDDDQSKACHLAVAALVLAGPAYLFVCITVGTVALICCCKLRRCTDDD